MSNISSNALFHFTTKAEYLIGILRETFIPRYSYEETKLDISAAASGVKKGAIPMTCFCDISLSQIQNHIKTYGSYGIGMTKEWGVRKKLNPIIYINEGSALANHYLSLVNNIRDSLVKDCPEGVLKLAINNLEISNYLKPYSGDFLRNGKTIKKVKFYNEREWRYIPEIRGDKDIMSVLDKKEFDNELLLAGENNKLRKFSLDFEPNDIKYIFVKDESEIHAMIKALRQIKGSRFDAETIDILSTKILTTKQIDEDF